MPRVRKESDVKKVLCKFYLLPDNKDKLSKISKTAKINMSELIDSCIEHFDEMQNLASNLNYIKEREIIFRQMAEEVFNLKEEQKKYLEDVQLIKDELAKTKNLIHSFKSYLDRKFDEIKPVGLIDGITKKLTGKDN